MPRLRMGGRENQHPHTLSVCVRGGGVEVPWPRVPPIGTRTQRDRQCERERTHSGNGNGGGSEQLIRYTGGSFGNGETLSLFPAWKHSINLRGARERRVASRAGSAVSFARRKKGLVYFAYPPAGRCWCACRVCNAFRRTQNRFLFLCLRSTTHFTLFFGLLPLIVC